MRFGVPSGLVFYNAPYFSSMKIAEYQLEHKPSLSTHLTITHREWSSQIDK